VRQGADRKLATLEGWEDVQLPVRIFIPADLVGFMDLRKWTSLASAAFSGPGCWFKNPPVLSKENLLAYRERRDDLYVFWKVEDSVACGDKWQRGSGEIEERRMREHLSAAKVKALLEELDRTSCFGARGPSPVNKALHDIRQLLIDGLHFKNNICLLTMEIMVKAWTNFGVLGLIREQAVANGLPKEVCALLYPKTMKASKKATYASDGGSWTAFCLHGEELLRPILVKAGQGKNGKLLELYLAQWNMLRCVSVMVKAACTCSKEGFDRRLVAYDSAAEQWVQLLFLFSPQHYLRHYVVVARYLLGRLMRSRLPVQYIICVNIV